MTGWVSRCFTLTPVLGCCALLGLCPEPHDGFAGPGKKPWLSGCSFLAWIATMNEDGEDSGRAQRLLLVAAMPSVVLPMREPVLAPPGCRCLSLNRHVWFLAASEGVHTSRSPLAALAMPTQPGRANLSPPGVSPAQPPAAGWPFAFIPSRSFKTVSVPLLGNQPPEDNRRAKDGVGPSFPLPW